MESLDVIGRQPDAAFWAGRRVLITGHTGFKGAWLSLWLHEMGAQVSGFALPPSCDSSLYTCAGVEADVDSVMGDLRDRLDVSAAVKKAAPEIVLHLAAQALVRPSVAEPVDTLATNVLGTAHLLDVLREVRPMVILVVTSDKVYRNDEQGRAFVETDVLGGDDPYSASKAACEIIARSWNATYFRHAGVRLATARAGNVIGGGDHASDRIIPDIIRAVKRGEQPLLRMPGAIRPWQHVLDCLSGYLVYAEVLAAGGVVPEALNFGPTEAVSLSVGNLTLALLHALGIEGGYATTSDNHVHEMGRLHIDANAARQTLAWKPMLDTDSAVQWTADWYSAALSDSSDPRQISMEQIAAYRKLAGG